MSLMEVCAVGLAVAYVLLAVYQRRLCWIAAIASAALYIVIFWQVQLYLEAALQVFYIAMARSTAGSPGVRLRMSLATSFAPGRSNATWSLARRSSLSASPWGPR